MNNLFLILALMPAISYAGSNSVDNVLNNNSGTVGNVTINQSNSVTEGQIESQEKINAALKAAMDEKNNQKAIVANMADDINKQNASIAQKNRLCKSQAKVGATVLGYKVDFAFGKCDEFFTTAN